MSRLYGVASGPASSTSSRFRRGSMIMMRIDTRCGGLRRVVYGSGHWAKSMSDMCFEVGILRCASAVTYRGSGGNPKNLGYRDIQPCFCPTDGYNPVLWHTSDKRCATTLLPGRDREQSTVNSSNPTDLSKLFFKSRWNHVLWPDPSKLIADQYLTLQAQV